LEILSPDQVSINIDFGEAHATSVGLLGLLGEEGKTVAEGVTSLLLSVHRLLAPEPQSDESEAMFLQATLDWIAAYYTEGIPN
jgi:hypothetical protein